jgi:glycerol kinase
MGTHVLAIDEGGTGVRAHVFDRTGRPVAAAYAEIPQSYPRPGWVEHDPVAIWDRTVEVMRAALADAGLSGRDLAAIGVANQRASVVLWDATSGTPIYPAIGWQDLRTVEQCADLARRGYLIVPGHSATKLAWVLEHVPEARRLARAGTLRLGTLDTWLTWKLSGGATYVSDPSNVCCTGLYDYVANRWDQALMEALDLPADAFPAIVPTSAVVGETAAALTGVSVPLGARAGDQQAAMFGELRLAPGMTKLSYGTAAMMDLNVGLTASGSTSPHRARGSYTSREARSCRLSRRRRHGDPYLGTRTPRSTRRCRSPPFPLRDRYGCRHCMAETFLTIKTGIFTRSIR